MSRISSVGKSHKKSQFFKRIRVELKHLRHIKYVMVARVVKKYLTFLTVCKYCDITSRMYFNYSCVPT